ncbi:MAG: hypothetical protein J6Q70_03290 [Clostridia bacterium]|nr:hypothetical protein [Clostridia bacterium]
MKTRHFLLLLVVLVSWWGVSCAPLQGGIDYIHSGGRGEVRGSMDGVEFSALITLSQKGEVLQVEYTSPSSLCGLKLRAQGESCEVALGEVSFVCNTAEVVGFLRPVGVFLPQESAKTVQKQGENTALTYPNGGGLILSPKGEPISFSGEGIDVRVIWWETGAE